jgi:hypothetical protein
MLVVSSDSYSYRIHELTVSVAEAGSIMSLAPSGARGKYLALWIVARNVSPVFLATSTMLTFSSDSLSEVPSSMFPISWHVPNTDVSLSKNHVKGAVGGVTPDTYIAFLIIECMALPFALLISPLENVVRSDGTRIVMAEKLSTKNEFKKIKYTMTSKLIMLSALWAVWSFFYSGSWVCPVIFTNRLS